MNEIIERVLASESAKAIWRNDYSSKEWIEASQINVHLFSLPLNRRRHCECVEDLFRHLKRKYSRDKIIVEMERKFFLKNGKVIMNHEFPNPLTQNSSDEELIYGLSKKPEIIIHFDKQPENWREICGLEEGKKGKVKKTEGEDPEAWRKLPFGKLKEYAENTLNLKGLKAVNSKGAKGLLLEIDEALNSTTQAPIVKLMKVITQEDLDNNPELVEQGIEVGQEVEIEAPEGEDSEEK